MLRQGYGDFNNLCVWRVIALLNLSHYSMNDMASASDPQLYKGCQCLVMQ